MTHRRIAVVSPQMTVAPHFETELELIQRHLDDGDEVDYLVCRGRLPNCDFNGLRVPAQCDQCRGRREHGLSKLTGRVRVIELGPGGVPSPGGQDEPGETRPPDWPVFNTCDDLRRLRLGSFDIGYGALSSLVSLLRDPLPDLKLMQPLVRQFLDASWMVWRQTAEYIRQHQPDCVYLFNGRFAAMRGVLRACQAAGTRCLIHERGCDPGHYQLFENHLPHDIDQVVRRMRQHWAQAPAGEDRTAVAGDWYSARRNRTGRDWTSFVDGQEPGRLPDDWNPRHRNVVFFTSSEDEFVAISDSWNLPLYASQLEGIVAIVRSLQSQRSDLRFWVRMHPNQGRAAGHSTRELRRLALPDLRVLEPESTEDTYGLLDAAEKVVTFGSTIGIEAVWWQRPSVLLGPCYYRDMAGPMRADSHDAAVALIASHLPPGPRQDAEVYGYWFGSHGTPYRYYEPEGLFHGRFRGEVLFAQPVRSGWLERIGQHARRLLGAGRRTGQRAVSPDQADH